MPTSDTHNSSSRHFNPWLITFAVLGGTFMEFLDGTIVNVALPHISANLAATTDEATWVLTSYLVANAIVLPITGWMATRFGRRNLLLISLAGFTIASLFCGMATSLPMLILWRIAQGFLGGGLQPFSMAILLEAFPPEKHGVAMASWMIAALTSPLLGPILGGYIVDNFTWRWIFYVNVPLGIFFYLLCAYCVFDPPYLRRNASNTVDYWGIILLSLAVGS